MIFYSKESARYNRYGRGWRGRGEPPPKFTDTIKARQGLVAKLDMGDYSSPAFFYKGKQVNWGMGFTGLTQAEALKVIRGVRALPTVEGN